MIVDSILNLTPYLATAEQVSAGAVDLPAEGRRRLAVLLTFDSPPCNCCGDVHVETNDIRARAVAVASLADGYAAAMIGGAMWLMAPLAVALRERGIRPFYAFSVRESVEETLSDGTVRKTVVFRHRGFVDAV